MNINKIEGLITAPFTPMKEDGSINVSVINSYAEKLKMDNLRGVFVCGTTGEGMLLTSEERRIVAENWIAEQRDDFKVIVHVGTTSSKQSCELAEHAQKMGAYAIGSMGPMFLKPARIEELVDFCKEIASGAPDLPFYYYHIPSISGIDLPMSKFIKLAAAQIPTFTGIKFTDNNFMEMQKCLNLDNGKWDILHGYDELLLAGLTFGAKGAVGSTYNFMAPLYLGIIEDFENGNIEDARKKQAVSVKIIEILIKYNGALVAGKSLMKTVGIDCGKCRPPLNNLSDNEYESFIKELDNVGYFEK